MKPLLKEEIILSFSPRERRKVRLPDLEKINWENLDFLSWIHPSGHLGYIVYSSPQGLKGIVLERSRKILLRGIRMCNLCYTLHAASETRLFVYKVNKNISIGDYMCADLQCSLYIRKLKKNNIAQMPETITLEQKIERLKENLNKFFSRINEISSI